MRMETAAVAKGQRDHSSHLLPAEGTRLRRLYDLFANNKGIVIEGAVTRFDNSRYSLSPAIEQLRNFYGMDIRKLGYKRWVLAGEWFGTTYRDYMADRFSEGENAE